MLKINCSRASRGWFLLVGWCWTLLYSLNSILLPLVLAVSLSACWHLTDKTRLGAISWRQYTDSVACTAQACLCFVWKIQRMCGYHCFVFRLSSGGVSFYLNTVEPLKHGLQGTARKCCTNEVSYDRCTSKCRPNRL